MIADIIRRRGFNGIRFPSSIASGVNHGIFKPGAFKVDDDIEMPDRGEN